MQFLLFQTLIYHFSPYYHGLIFEAISPFKELSNLFGSGGDTISITINFKAASTNEKTYCWGDRHNVLNTFFQNTFPRKEKKWWRRVHKGDLEKQICFWKRNTSKSAQDREKNTHNKRLYLKFKLYSNATLLLLLLGKIVIGFNYTKVSKYGKPEISLKKVWMKEEVKKEEV